jgi:hypothetical protein
VVGKKKRLPEEWLESGELSGADQKERELLDQKENNCWIKTRILLLAADFTGKGISIGFGSNRSGAG